MDKLGDRVAFGQRVASLVGASDKKVPGDFRAIPLADYVEATPERIGGDPIGVVTIAGMIVDGSAPAGTAGGDTIANLLLKALAGKNLKALVVRVDSPGGSVSGSDRIRGAILEAKRRGLPIVVSMGSVAASGGYWVSTPADMIFAQPSTITGSIGVFGLFPTFEGSLAKLGLGADGVRATPLSGEPDVLKGTTPQVDALMQAGVNQTYARFTGLVAQARHLPIQRVDEIAQGHVWEGGTARQLGLVDRFGTLDDAIAEAARRAKLDPAKVHPVFIERQPSATLRFLRDALSRGTGSDDNAGDDAGIGRGDPYAMIAARPDTLLAQAMEDARTILAGPSIQARCLSCPSVAPPPRQRSATLATLLLARLGLR